MNYEEHKRHESAFLLLTSLTVIEFDYLFSHFEPLWEKYYRYHTFIEHANSGLKQLRMMKDVLRIRHSNIRDTIRVVATGLHNLRVSAIDTMRAYQQSARVRVYLPNLLE
jgi:hypothetical protein